MTDLATNVAGATGRWLERRFSRRGLLGRTAVVGSALAVSPLTWVLTPTTAYASVCGGGAACDEGWSAMCCTIHQGVNLCPAGSFPGGWWKADQASLCGGGARYYIDCQATCDCGCPRGSPFCREGCWSCRPHCASGTCDERRVCWNVFRYGQCNQQRACTGPVVCRMISCVPPWEFEDCTRDAATDNPTVSHSAPCLSPWSAIQQHYARLGGPGSPLGATVRAEHAVTGGREQRCENGAVYWSRHTGPHAIYGSVYALFAHYSGLAGMGFPSVGQGPADNGRGTSADFGPDMAIYAGPPGTYRVSGAALARWRKLAAAGGPLGFPTAESAHVPTGGHVATFEHGAVYTPPGAGTSVADGYAVYRAISSEYNRLGGPATVGLPSASQQLLPGGGEMLDLASGGAIYWSAATGAHLIPSAALTVYRGLGAQSSPLGYPTTDPITDGAEVTSRFTGGAICTAPPGTFEVLRAVYEYWQSYTSGPATIGYPTSNTATTATTETNTFTNGTVTCTQPGSCVFTPGT